MVLEGEGGSASISQNRTDSYRCQPEPPRTRAAQLVNTSFSIRLGGYQSAERLPISVDVTRPFDDPRSLLACGDRSPGTKTVRFDTQADLGSGKPVVVTGDAGLNLTIVRSGR
jgi:hypothetical protein